MRRRSSAVDPSEPFVVAARERHPGVDVRQAAAEELPFADGEFDAALAQLVVHFMADPVRGLAEMGRVTKNGGVVCACVWDHAGDQSPLTPFWQAVRELDPGADAEADLAGTREGQLTELFREAGLREVEETALRSTSSTPTFEDWWEPFTLGVGPAGVYFASLDATKQAELREACQAETARAAVHAVGPRLDGARQGGELEPDPIGTYASRVSICPNCGHENVESCKARELIVREGEELIAASA